MNQTIDSLLEAARAAGLSRLDAQLLLAHALKRPRTWLLAHGDEAVDPLQAGAVAELLQQRARGVPLAYLVGEREFHGLMLQVSPSVLVPRPDTETLVDWALELLAPDSRAAVADLGTGSGAIALALRRARPHLRLTAVDASAAALEVAMSNGVRLGLPVEWVLGHWCGPLAGRQFDLLVSNPPYIEDGDPHLAQLQAEPREALTPGPDGLASLREIIAASPACLKPGGWLLLEHGHDQSEAVCALLKAGGFEEVSTRPDLAGRPRCSGGRWAAVVTVAQAGA